MESSTSLLDYWLVLYRRKFILLLVVISSSAFAYSISVWLPPLYEAKATFYMPANNSPATFTNTNFANQLAQPPLLPTPEEKASSVHLGILKSQRIMGALHKEFPLRPLDKLRKNVDITVGGEFLIEVYVRDEEPDMAARIANFVPGLYRRFHEEIQARRIQSVRGALIAQQREIEAQLTAFKDELRILQEQTGVLLPTLFADRLSELIRELRLDLEVTTTRMAGAREKVRALREQLDEERKLYREGELVMSSPRLEQLQSRLIDINAEIVGVRLDPLDPGLPLREAELQATLDETRQVVQVEMRRLVESRSKLAGSIHERLRLDLIDEMVELNSLKARRDALAESVARLESDKERLPDTTGRINDLNARIAPLNALREQVNNHLLEATLQSSNLSPSVVDVESAAVPLRPVFPLTLLNAIVAGIGGLVVGCYYVLFVDYLTRLRRYRLRRQMDWSPLEHLSLPSVQTLLKEWEVQRLEHQAGDNSRYNHHYIDGQHWEIREHQTPKELVVSQRRRLANVESEEPQEAGNRPSDNVLEEAYIVYDKEGRVVDVSANYSAMYPAIADLIKPGAHLHEILRAAAIRGDIPDARGRVDEWVQQKIRDRLNPGSGSDTRHTTGYRAEAAGKPPPRTGKGKT